jgi:hypothetical protein
VLEGSQILAALLLYCSIGALPLWMVPLHGASQRLLNVFKPQMGVQAGALVAIAAVNVAYALFVLWCAMHGAQRSALDTLAGVVFVGLAVNAMAFFYFQCVNVALTSIHMSVLLRIFWVGALSQDILLSDYSDEHMVRERIGRLLQLKQIEVGGDMVRLRSKIMVFAASPIYLWRRLLGISSSWGRHDG